MQTFNCSFSAIGPRGKKIVRKFRIEARDAYQAQDIVVEEIGKDYGSMLYPTFKFNLPAKKMPRGLRKIVAGAGPDEE